MATRPNTRLKRERELRGWSQAKLAELVGTQTPTVSRWERGISFPYPYFREKLCALFGKDASSLGLVPPDDEEGEGLAEGLQGSATCAPAPAQCVNDPVLPFFAAGAFELIGREALLAQLKRRLCSGESLALSGLPGVGKTTLAMALAADREIRAHFSGGIFWAGLGPEPDVIAQLSRWGGLLGVSAGETGRISSLQRWEATLRTAIGARRMLLIIDDAWELESALAFRVGGPHCAYLVTTRLPSIAVAFADDGAIVVPELTQEDGVRLLSRFAPEAVAHDPETACALVRSVGALPLALALMGKHLRVQAASGQPRRLHTAIEHLRDAERRLRLAEPAALISRPGGAPTGTSLSLQSVIAVSDQQLSMESREALRALAVFPARPNTFSEEAALAVCQVPVEVLDDLSDAGLLESSSPGRYMLHQTIADYARTYLNEQAPYDRLVAYAIHYIESHITDYDALEQESSTILVALRAAHRLGRKRDLVWGTVTIAPFLQVRGLHQVAEYYLHLAYEAAASLQDRQGLMSVVLHLGKIAQERGDYTQAETYLREGLSLARQLSDHEQMSALLQSLGMVANERKMYGEAEVYFREGLVLARLLDDHEQIGALLQNRGAALARREEYLEAEVCFHEGLALARRLDDREQISALLQNLGIVAQEQAHYAQAEAYLHEGLALARQLGHRERMSTLLSSLGWTATMLGKYAQAEAYLHEGLTLAQRLGQRERVAVLLQNLGVVASKRGNQIEAKTYFHEALELARALGDDEHVCILLLLLGESLTPQGPDVLIDSYLQESLTLARGLRQPSLLGAALAARGEYLLVRHEIEAAMASFQEALELLAPGAQELRARLSYGLARAHAACGRVDDARQLAALALSLYEQASSPHAAEVREWLGLSPPERLATFPEA
jgi:tetratricopeptide (TPR) repeat protein/transcriptional regulator with XRE-family HTH domain